VKDPVHPPLLIVAQPVKPVIRIVLDGLALSVKANPLSAEAKPEAVTDTTVLRGPAAGVNVSLGVVVVTVNVAVAKSPVLPRTLIVCAPTAAEALTLKEQPLN